MKILLDYDAVTGMIINPATNTSFFIGVGLKEHRVQEPVVENTRVDDALSLKAGGFTAEEINLLLKDN